METFFSYTSNLAHAFNKKTVTIKTTGNRYLQSQDLVCFTDLVFAKIGKMNNR